jgi:hypothetical protein
MIDPLNPKPAQVKALLEAENRRLEQKRYHSDSNACHTMQAMVEQLLPKAATAPPELRTYLQDHLKQVRENCGGWGDHAMPWRLLAEAAYVLGILEQDGDEAATRASRALHTRRYQKPNRSLTGREKVLQYVYRHLDAHPNWLRNAWGKHLENVEKETKQFGIKGFRDCLKNVELTREGIRKALREDVPLE